MAEVPKKNSFTTRIVSVLKACDLCSKKTYLTGLVQLKSSGPHYCTAFSAGMNLLCPLWHLFDATFASVDWGYGPHTHFSDHGVPSPLIWSLTIFAFSFADLPPNDTRPSVFGLGMSSPSIRVTEEP